MKTRHSLFFLLPALLLIVFSFNSDNEPLQKLLGQLEKLRTDYSQEKVHLHLDKPYYAIGDNIWFKAYVVSSAQHQLSNLSKILYVDLIDEKDSIKQSLTLPLEFGLAWGDFTLADTLREGNYRIRAYTNWMRNFGEEYFFDRNITIGNSITNQVITDVKYKFSPEGNGQKVQADIRYTDLEGKPLAKKEVNYNIQLDFRNIAKGKGKTNDKGILQVNFINSQPFILKSGKIYTSIKLDNTKVVSKTIPVKATSNDVDVQFFPESGDLVQGIRSKVAFKALGAEGLGLNVSGKLTDSKNAVIADFKSEHAGMGYFALMPQPGEKYTAHIRFEDGSEKTYDLPRALPQGYVLTASNLDPDELLVKIAASPALTAGKEVTLLAQSNGIVKYLSKVKMDMPSFNAKIPKNRFPTGILQLTLFSPDEEPVAERLVFIQHPDSLSLNMSSTKTDFKKREKVKLTPDAKDFAGKPEVGSFSLSVIDESKVPFNEADETTILSNLLLTSDLKGFIEQPNYYFSDINENTIRQLDILMLSQGWRRFAWKNIMAGTFPPLTFQPENSMRISGRVLANKRNPVVGGKVTLFSPSGDMFLLDTLTDNEGRFDFNNLFFHDSTKFAVQARNVKDRKNVEIQLNALPPQMVTQSKNAATIEVNVNNSMSAYLKNSRNQFDELRRFGMVSRNITLAEVNIVDKKSVVKYSSNLNGAGHADFIITANDLEYAHDITRYLQARTPGVSVSNGTPYLTRNTYSSFSGLAPMKIVFDGIYVQPEFLSSLNPGDIETIEILKNISNTAIYGMSGDGGVMVITSKKGLNYRNYAPGILSYTPKGFYKVREFYSPNYDDPKSNTQMADLRTTIYWNPHILIDQSGKASVEFFNADGKGSYVAILEGITAEGKLGRTIYRYRVN